MTNIVESAMLRESVGAVMKETRSFRPFKSSEEYLYAMKEDLAEWLHMLYPELDINVDNFMDRLDTGVALCKHANSVRQRAREYLERRQARRMTASTTGTTSMALTIAEMGDVHFLPAAKPGTFFARDNVSNFISWCRRGLNILECLLFETDDLILRKNEKHVILCLLEVARRGSRFGMLAPMLVQLEREIDREIAAEQRALQRANSVEADDEEEDEDDDEGDGFLRQYGPMPQIVTNDLKSLDEMVRDLVERCTCPVQFPMIRVSEGKYRIGDTKVLIFVRILRNHVMVRVGGGWDTLSHYLDKHDPCRCKTAHRSPLSTKLILKSNGPLELNNAQVLYERSPPRTRRSSASSVSSGGGGGVSNTLPVTGGANRSRSPTPRRSLGAAPSPGTYLHPRPASHHGGSSSAIDILCNSGRRSTTPTSGRNRSRSPTPRLNVPGSPSRRASNTGLDRRSRSPTPTKNRPPSRNSAVNAVDNNNLQQQMNINNNNDAMAEKEIPSTVVVAAEHDSGSEVSDEGYRSLGLVNPSSTVDPASATKAAEADESKQEETRLLQTESEDTRQLECPVITTQRPPSECGSCESGSVKNRKTSDAGRMTRSRSTDHTATPLDSLPGSPRRSAVQYRSMRSDPRTSASSSQPGSPRRQPVSNTNTWSGRQGKAKQRPSLTGTTFMGSGSSFDVSNRNSFQRRSLGAYGGAGGSVQSSPGRTTPAGTARRHKGSLPASLQGSPTKQISPLLEQILQVKELDDDITVLNKMREIIQHYSDIVDEKLGEETRHEKQAASGETLPVEDGVDFTSAWVHGNGTLDGIRSRKSSCASDYVPKAAPSPRKDSKVEGSVSRIPAPIFYRPTAATTVELTTRDS